jgi:hypothetical protein
MACISSASITAGELGRYIAIYYGSFLRVYGHLGREELKDELKKTLKHEFLHHLEAMAGARDLERRTKRIWKTICVTEGALLIGHGAGIETHQDQKQAPPK